MKLLLIGPYPPPHGGISVHVAAAKKQLDQAGFACRVLNLNRSAPQSSEYVCYRSSMELLFVLFQHARQGWTFHLHTNGHNRKSWLVALACGLIGQLAPASLLTIHSGMAPPYLKEGGTWCRFFVRFVCRFYNRLVAVNYPIREALATLGVPPDRLEVVPAYLSAAPAAALPPRLQELLKGSRPLLTSVLFYRPEYGFDLLVHALSRLRKRYPNLRCLVMGSGEQQTEARRLVREQAMQDAIKLLGDLQHELCLALISASDVFVRPTLEDADSISVREALSLGVPAVVSDVGHRPPGVLLFRPGDCDDLVSRLEAVLASNRSPAPGADLPPSSVALTADGCPRLLEVYSRAAIQGV